MGVWGSRDLWNGHRRPKTAKNAGKGGMEKLAAESAVVDVVSMSFVRYEKELVYPMSTRK